MVMYSSFVRKHANGDITMRHEKDGSITLLQGGKVLYQSKSASAISGFLAGYCGYERT